MPKLRRKRIQEFIQVFKDPLGALGQDMTLTASMWRTLATMLSLCKYGGYVVVSQREIAARVQVSPGQVSRILAELVRRGVILREAPLHGRQWQYRVSTLLAHMGDTAELAWRRSRDTHHIFGVPLPASAPKSKDAASSPKKGRSTSSRPRSSS